MFVTTVGSKIKFLFTLFEVLQRKMKNGMDRRVQGSKELPAKTYHPEIILAIAAALTVVVVIILILIESKVTMVKV